MRILHVITSLELGGAEKLLTELLPEQRKLGNEVELLVLDTHGEVFLEKIKERGIKVHTTPFDNRKSPKNIFYIGKIVREGKFDVVHAHLTHAQYWTGFSRFLDFSKRTYVTTEHSTSNRRRGNRILKEMDRIVYGQFDKIISISPATEFNLVAWLGEGIEKKSRVIENGIETEGLEGNVRSAKRCELLMVSRFHPSKDHATVVRALEMLPKEYTVSFAGAGETMERCKKLVADMGLGDRVNFLGYCNNVRELFKEYDIAIQSSNYEGFGIGALEAMASGLPVVASDVPGLREVVSGGGLLFRPEDAEDLASKIRYLEDTEHYRDVSRAGIEKSLEFTIGKTAKRYVDYYREEQC